MNENKADTQAAAIEEAIAEFKRLGELLKELEDCLADTFEELMEYIEFPEREKYALRRKICFTQAPQTDAKLWRENRAIFRPYKRAHNSRNQSTKEAFV